MTTPGPVVLDLRGHVEPTGTSGPQWPVRLALALGSRHPGLVSAYVVDGPARSGRSSLGPLLAAGGATVLTSAEGIPPEARCFVSTAPCRTGRSLAEVWPPAVEHRGMRFVALFEGTGSDDPSDRRDRRRAARLNVVRLADAVVTAPSQLASLEALGVPSGRLTVLRGDGDDGFDEAVDTTAAALEALSSLPRRAWAFPGGLAVVSPFPPIESGVATYSLRLLRALGGLAAARRRQDEFALRCFADGLDRSPAAADAGVTAECADARGFRRFEATLGGFEHVLYVVGNSPYHTGALAALRERPGVVMAHDVDLSNLIRFSTWRLGAVPGGLEGAVRRHYGGRVPDGLGRGDVLSQEDVDRFGLFFFDEVGELASRVLVNSEAARALALRDGGEHLAGRLAVVPFAIALDDDELEVVREARAEPGDGVPVVASFGIVDPTKQPALLVEAVASLAAAGRAVRLMLVGPVSEALRDELVALADRLGVGERLDVTGVVERVDYLRALGRADVAVQLRRVFRGEASAAAGDCLAAGLPTIVSDLGWLGELPEDAVLKLSPAAGPPELAAAIASLLDDQAKSTGIAEAAARFAAGRTYAAVATAVLDELSRAVEQPA